MRATLFSNWTGSWQYVAGYHLFDPSDTVWICDENHNKQWNYIDVSYYTAHNGFGINGTWAYYNNGSGFHFTPGRVIYWSVNVTDNLGCWTNQTYSFTSVYTGITMSHQYPTSVVNMTSTAINIRLNQTYGQRMRVSLWSNITTGVWHQIAGYGNSTWFGCDFNHNNLWNAADLSEWSAHSGYQLNGTWAYFINDTSFGPLVLTHKYWWSVHVSDGYAWKNQTFSFTDLYPGSGITISNPIPANGTSMYPGVTDWSVDIYSGGTVNWTIQCHSRNGSTIINSTGVNNLSGTKTAHDCHFFDYNRNYIIYVNATNSYNISQHSVFHLITQASAPASLGTPNPANNSENISVAFKWSIPITKDVRDTLIDYTYTINCYNYLGALIGTHTENNINLSSKSAYIVFFGLLSNKTYTINISVLDYYGNLNHTLSITWVNRTYRFTTVDISDYTGWWDTNWKAKKRLSYDVSVSEASGLQVLINITKGAYGASDDLNVYPPRIVINSSNLGECRFVANYVNHTTGHDGYTVLPVWVDVIKLPSGTSYLSQTKTLPFFTGKIQQGKALSWWYN